MGLKLSDGDEVSLPHNREAEQGVLGCILIDNGILSDVAEMLGVNDFYEAEHQTIYQAMFPLRDRDQVLTVSTLAEKLTPPGFLQEIGVKEMLVRIATCIPNAGDVMYYASIVREKSIRRNLINELDQVVGSCHNTDCDLNEIIDSLARIIDHTLNRKAGIS